MDRSFKIVELKDAHGEKFYALRTEVANGHVDIDMGLLAILPKGTDPRAFIESEITAYLERAED